MNCSNHPDRERVAFCQNCGKPLCSECTRTIGSAVFCEPCLAARLAAADTASSTGTPYGNVNVPYGGTPPVAPIPGAPNPVLAGLLGLIPGVGAMYNGQYPKGIVHLVVFVILVSLTDNNGVFGLFVAGWVFYQAIEAHHTARARRDGTPLPNPFGLNDIGEKLGFNKSWVSGVTTPPVPPPTEPYSTSYSAPFTATPPSTPPPTQGWGAPTDSYNYSYNYAVPPVPPYTESLTDTPPYPQRSNFPVGAILLIAFGVLFFVGSTGWLHGFPIHRIIPFLLIALGVWLFVRKMTNTGYGMSDDGTPAYRLRLFRALRGSIWVILVGILFFLDSFDILSWGHSWPLFIIVAGLMTFFERSAYSAATAAPYAYAAPGAPPPASSTSTASGNTSIVPSSSHDEEGR